MCKRRTLTFHLVAWLQLGKGYDHNWVIHKPAGKLSIMASVYDPEGGRMLEVLSTEPGLQIYSGNSLDGSSIGKNGQAYAFRTRSLEPQHYPDSPNRWSRLRCWMLGRLIKTRSSIAFHHASRSRSLRGLG